MVAETLKKIAPNTYQLKKTGPMRVPGIIFSDEVLLRDMEDKVLEQVGNVASLPGIVGASMAMPDAHSGYGFPIGGVGAFDPERGGVISAGGVGFDIACGIRSMLTGIHRQDIMANRKVLADLLFKTVPAGLGAKGGINVSSREIDQILSQGAYWAVKKGFGRKEDLEKIEEGGTAREARPDYVSEKAKKRQENQMGTLGSGNHYLEVQAIDEIFDHKAANAFGLRKDDVVVCIHCGSRGLGHQVATDYMRLMVAEARQQKIYLPDRDLACAPAYSQTGKMYLGAMRSAINCALANRQIITHLAREVFSRLFPSASMNLIYDVSHNTCREEYHQVDNNMTRLFVHRKGATRAFGPGSPDLPSSYMEVGQPVLIGGSMGTSSYILVGTREGMQLGFGSACHGAGRVMSRKQASKKFRANSIIDNLSRKGIEIRGHSFRGLAEEAPESYKDVNRVIQVSHDTALARKVARLTPMVCVKG